jgi:uncharacterized Zn-finger protein
MNALYNLMRSTYVFDLHLSSEHGEGIELRIEQNFVGKRELNRHVASVHDGKKKFQCNACETSFSQNAHLSRHKASVHE